MTRDLRTTTPQAAAVHARLNSDRDPRHDGIRADDVEPARPHPHCDDLSCRACFLLPEVQARLVAEIRGTA